MRRTVRPVILKRTSGSEKRAVSLRATWSLSHYPAVLAVDRDFERMRDLVAKIDPALVRAMDDVDVGLLEWSLSLSPWERLSAATDTLRVLASFRRVTPAAR